MYGNTYFSYGKQNNEFRYYWWLLEKTEKYENITTILANLLEFFKENEKYLKDSIINLKNQFL